MRRSTRVRGRVRLALLASVLVAAGGTDADAYLKLGLRDSVRAVSLHWTTQPAPYLVNDGGVPGVTPEQFRQAADRAFRTWEDVPTASVRFAFGGFTDAAPLDDDNTSTLGFLSRPELERVLASTNFFVDTRTGEIVESDIFFNSSFPWSVAENGEAGRFDLQSILLHEAGHFLGLSHSALGETEPRSGGGRRVLGAGAVMFPIAFASGSITGRTLFPDDIAGVSDIYPDAEFRQKTGSVQGRVTKGGTGVFGAHVVAYDPQTGNMVGNFALEDTGEFIIAGLRPGPHILRVEPLDDAEVESFFDRIEPGSELPSDLLQPARRRAARRRHTLNRNRREGKVTHGGTVGTGVLIAALAVSGVADARAQTAKPAAQRQPARPRPAFRPGSIEVDGGVLWLSGIDFGSTTAAIAANRTPAAEYPLFNTTGELKAGPAYEGRVGVRLTRMIGVEGAFQVLAPGARDAHHERRGERRGRHRVERPVALRVRGERCRSPDRAQGRKGRLAVRPWRFWLHARARRRTGARRDGTALSRRRWIQIPVLSAHARARQRPGPSRGRAPVLQGRRIHAGRH